MATIGYDTINFVDRFSKRNILVPTTSTVEAAGYARHIKAF